MSACPKSIAAGFLAIALAVAGTGCTATGDAQATDKPATKSDTASAPLTLADLLPLNRPPIADLPVPNGFMLVESISRSYDWGSGRVVDHTYEGRAEKQEIERFYARQMPAQGWTRASTETVRGSSRLEFTNPRGERCAIELADIPQPRIFAGNVRINTTILPAAPAKP